jgi:DNA-binding NtrC family response regulator
MKNKEAPWRWKLLVVEDEAVIRDLVGRVLGDMNCDLVTVENADTALDLIGNSSFDALLTDLRLPGGSGVEIIRRFKTKFPEAPVVIMTGSLTPEERIAELGDQQVIACIHKPFDLQVLQRVMTQAFAGIPS